MSSTAPELPKTRDQALRLLQAADYNFNMLSPEEREAVRMLYYLDDNRPVSERMKGGRR